MRRIEPPSRIRSGSWPYTAYHPKSLLSNCRESNNEARKARFDCEEGLAGYIQTAATMVNAGRMSKAATGEFLFNLPSRAGTYSLTVYSSTRC
jgi:hypothetical protein